MGQVGSGQREDCKIVASFKKCLVSLFKVCVYICVEIYTQTLFTLAAHAHLHTHKMYTYT